MSHGDRRPARRRVAVYTDYAYRRDSEGVWAERAFALFLAGLADYVESLSVIGRLNPAAGAARYRLPDHVRFVPLPHYESLDRPQSVGAMARSLVAIWRALDDVDAIWLLGPHPLAIAAVALAVLRRRRVLLGVRQDLPAYVRSRHRGRPILRATGTLLDLLYRMLSRVFPTIVVGPALAVRYRGARRLLEITVSLVPAAQIADDGETRSYAGPLQVLSVGRLEEEKNPLLLAEVLARLASSEREWRLQVLGEGPLSEHLERRFQELAIADHCELRGYVPHHELAAVYGRAHFLLHSSWTEGLPQVIVEALAAGLPVVASDVGGIRAAVGEAVLLYPAGDDEAAADHLDRLAGRPEERKRLVEGGLRYARLHSLEAELERLARFIDTA